jgi:N12 class adenine-specific DNA methylase
MGILPDEINRQMDRDLFGQKKSFLDPKISLEMDRDLGIPSARWTSAIKPIEPEEPGYISALGQGIYSGFRRRLPEMVGQAIQFTAGPETGKGITEWARQDEERPQFKSAIKQALYEGGEMLAPSVAIPAALGVAGVGVVPASVATAVLFGLSQAQSTKEEAEKRGVEPGAAPYATGAIEALGEAAGTAALARLLGPLAPLITKGGKAAVKGVIKPTLSRILKEFPRTMAIEGGTEFGQQAGEAAVEKYAGIRPEAEPLREGLGVIGPTAVLTGLTMGMAAPVSRLRGRSLERVLTDPKADPRERANAVNEVASYLAEADKDIAQKWWRKAFNTVRAGQPIPVDQDIYEWIGYKGEEKEKPQKAIPAEEKEAIPAPEIAPGQAQGYDLLTKKPIQEQPAPAEETAARAIPEEETAWKDLLPTLETAPLTGEPGPVLPESPAVTGEELRAALAGKEPAEKPAKTVTGKEKPVAPKGFFPAGELWNKRVGEVQDEWYGLMAHYAEEKAKTEEEIKPLQKALDDLKGKRDKASAARKKEIREKIETLRGKHEAARNEAENRYIEENLKFGEMVREEAKKRGIPEDRLSDFVTDFQIISSPERPYIETNYNLTHRKLFDNLVQEHLGEEEEGVEISKRKEAPKPSAIPESKIIEPVESPQAEGKVRILQETTDRLLKEGGYTAAKQQPRSEAGEQALYKKGYRPYLPGEEGNRLVEHPLGVWAKAPRANESPQQAMPVAGKVEEAAVQAATSPASALPEPTEAQKEAGNYRKGHVSLHGLDISIENPRGSARSGVSAEGKRWTSTLAHHYGYIRGTKGRDKDHLDVFIGPHPESEFVAVIDQVDPETGKFDEHKVMLGFETMAEAQVGYLANYDPGWTGLGGARGFDILEFKDWLKGDTTKPVARPAERPVVSPVERPVSTPVELTELTEPRQLDRAKAEIVPGLTYRQAAENLLPESRKVITQAEARGRLEKIFGSQAKIKAAVERGAVTKADILHNINNEFLNIVNARVEAGADMTEELDRAKQAGKDLRRVLDLETKIMPAPAIPQPEPRKAAIPVSEMPPGFPESFRNTKVVDRDGVPMRMFHASPTPIEEFKETGKEIKFYSRPLHEYFGENVYEAYLDIENPAGSLDEWMTNQKKYDGAFWEAEDYEGRPGFLAAVKSPKQIHVISRTEPGKKEKEKEAAIPQAQPIVSETGRRDRDEVLRDLIAGRISPDEAVKALGIPGLPELNKILDRYVKANAPAATEEKPPAKPASAIPPVEKEKPALPEAEENAAGQEEQEEFQGIPIDKPVTELTDEEFEKIIAPAPQGMDRRNTELARFENDPRFYAPLKQGERGYQPGRPQEHQPVHTDWHAVRTFIETGRLPDRGREIQRYADRLGEMDPGVGKEASRKVAAGVLNSVERGYYNDFLHPANKNARKLFRQITGLKLPMGVTATRNFFQGQPFPKLPPEKQAQTVTGKPRIKIEDLQKVSEDYYGYIVDKAGAGNFQKIGGIPVAVKGLEEFDLSVRREGDNAHITEGISGRLLARKPTEKEARLSLEQIVKKHGIGKIRELIEDSVNSLGYSPRYAARQEEERARLRSPQAATAPEKPVEIRQVEREEIPTPETGVSPPAPVKPVAEASEKPSKYYLINPQTGKMEMYFSRAEYQALDDYRKEQLRKYFLWSPGRKAWISKASKDLFWPRSVARKIGLEELREKAQPSKTGLEAPKTREELYSEEIREARLDESVGPEGRKIWKQWLNRMAGSEKYEPGKVSERDLASAKSWFMKLYDAGTKGMREPTKAGGLPINADERQAYEAAKVDARLKMGERKPAPEPGKTNIERFAEELKRNGAARIGNADYKIHQNDAGSYYYSVVENGIRITHGPVAPYRGMGQWSLEKSQGEAIDDARGHVPHQAEKGKPAAALAPPPAKFKIGDQVQWRTKQGWQRTGVVTAIIPGISTEDNSIRVKRDRDAGIEIVPEASLEALAIPTEAPPAEVGPEPEAPKFEVGDIVEVTPESGLNVGWGGKVTQVVNDVDGVKGKQLISVEGRRFQPPSKFKLVRKAGEKPAEPEEMGKGGAQPEETRMDKAEEEEPEPSEEILPRKIPYEAVKYANAIKNKLKKNYAWAYLKWRTGKIPQKPESKGLSGMAAQIIEMSIDKMLGEPYKFKPIAEKAEGGSHGRHTPETTPGAVVAGPPGVGERKPARSGEEALREEPGGAGQAPHPEGRAGEQVRVQAGGEGGGRAAGPEPGLRRGDQPAASGESARTARPGPGEEDRRLGRRVQPERLEDRNHVIGAEDTLVPAGKISRIKANVAAIQLAKTLEKEKRNPTPEEKKKLAQFTGWGALGKEAFEPAENVRYDEDKNGTLPISGWPYFSEDARKEYKAWFDRIGKQLHPDLGGLLTEEEWEEAKSSILNAFYTSREVVENGLWPIIQRLGFKGGTILEPSAGVGHILGLMPRDISENSRILTVEKDRVSGLILGKLYPQAKVFVKGFEETKQVHDNSLDLVVSNFPFGDFKVFDPRHKDYSGFNIHNYFFARSIDALKPGGLLVAITSHYTLDAAGTEVRKYLASKADLVGGLRLPQTAFEKSAGTEVTTDILVFRKKDASIFKGQPFIDTLPVDAKEKDEKGKPKAAYVNEYFVTYPEMVLGEHSLSGTMYGGKEEYTLLPLSGKDLKDILSGQIAKFPANIAGEGAVETEPPPPTLFADEGTKEGILLEKEGKIYINEGGVLKPLFTGRRADAARRYIAVRGVLKDLINKELSEGSKEKEIEDLRKRLNRLYDDFVAKHGPISDKENQWLKEDAEFSLMLSLEWRHRAEKDWTYTKAPIFSKRTNFPFKEPAEAASPEDAVKISLTYRNTIDLPYIARLLKADKPVVSEAEREEIKDILIKNRLAYQNPATGVLESPDEYLSGNVREKLARAEEAIKDNPQYETNVEDLKKIQPENLGINQIYFRLGSPWIPTETVENFIAEFLDYSGAKVSYIRDTDSSRFTLATGRWGFSGNAKITNVWGVEGANALDLIHDSLNLRFTSIYDTEMTEDRKPKQVYNAQKSAAAREMQRRIQEEFVKWVRGHEKWGKELADIYNRDFNNTVLKKFAVPTIDYYPNASHDVKLRDHQRRSVSRNLQESNIVAHAVGTGKTYIFATTAMEMRRLGTARKPLIVVQGSTVHQYAKAFRQLYPTANILIPTKRQLAAENRKRLISQVVTGNWDAVIIPHSVFDMISVNPEKEAAFIREQVGELEKIIGEMKAEGEDKRNIRQVEKLKEKKETKLKNLLDVKKENLLYFEEMGFDALLVDEAHRYKRSEFFTKMQNIKGIDRQSASRSALLLLKAREVREKTNGKNVIIATGTPISNTVAEAWTLLRYVRPDLLEQFGARDFDSFAANFGEVVRDTEETPSGDFRIVERFARYVNGPELLKMWRTAADIVLPEDVEVKRPKIKSGKPIDLQLERPQELARFIEWIKSEREAWDSLPGKEKREQSHVPLVLFGLARKAAIDLRLVDPAMPDLPGSKVNRTVEETFKRWKAGASFRGTQVIFSDTFQSSDKKFNLFKDIKAKLIARGVPAKEIAIIHDFGSDEKREELFDNVNGGDVRVIMGTTEKLGVGVNIQDRLMAAHHIDVPNRPMDFEQRNGRIWRPGNLNDEVEILVYGVKNTLDSTAFQRLLIKQKFINQMMRGDLADRSFDDPFDPTQSTFQDMMAAFGNPKVREKFGLENQIRDLKTLKDSHEKEVARAQERIERSRREIRFNRESLKKWEEVAAELATAFPDDKVKSLALEIDGKMTPVERDKFIITLDEKVEGFGAKVKEVLDQRYHTAKEMFAAVEAAAREYQNVRGKVNGILLEIDLKPRMQYDPDDKFRYFLSGIEILYELKTGNKLPNLMKLTRTVNTPSGILISLVSLSSNTRKMPDEVRKDIARAENQIATLEPLLGQAFPRDAEIEEKKKRLEQVEAELRTGEGEQSATKEERERAEEENRRMLRAEYGNLSERLYRKEGAPEEEPPSPGEPIQEAEETAEEGKKPAESPKVERGETSFQLEVPPFYSALQRTIEQKMGGSMPAAQLRVLLKQPGIKQEEVQWTGIDDFLAGKTGKISKQEVLDFLERNRLQIKEINRGAIPPEAQKRLDEAYDRMTHGGQISHHEYERIEKEIERQYPRPKFEQYTVPGGENYRELLFTLPDHRYESPLYSINHIGDGNYEVTRRDNGSFVGQYPDRRQAQEAVLKLDKRPLPYRSGHWEEPNVLAHVRFNERTDTGGKRVLFIEEIQSDWHQEGRRKGYAGEVADGYELLTERGERFGIYPTRQEAEGQLPPGRGWTIREHRKPGVPPAPFAKTWHEFVLKRMARWAAENGFDRIAWTTGEQQAERYNLSQAIKRIEWEKIDFEEENPTVTLSIQPKEVDQEELYREIGRRTGIPWDTDPDAGPLLYVPADRLEDVIGKDLTKRIIEDPADMGSLEGENLKIGGKGMKGFYDKIVPDFLNKFGKKWDAKVEEIDIETGILLPGDAENELVLTERDTVLRPVHSFPITEAMKNSALTEGFPLFLDRAPWSRETARVIPHSTIEKLKSHPDYVAAKSGDDLAGLRVARAMMKPERIAELKKSLGGEKRVVIIVPMRMLEKGERNTIPLGMAAVIADQTGWEIDESIHQINDVAHTEKDALERLFAQAEFEGDVTRGATYIILDDVVTTGGTLANLKGFIEARGGKVKAIQTIGAAQFATNLKVMPGTVRKLRETYGQSLKEVLEYVYGGPTHEKNLTESEARTFIRNKGKILERAGKAKTEGRFGQGIGLDARRAPQRRLPEKGIARRTAAPEGWGRIEPEPTEEIPHEELADISALVEKIASARVVFQDIIQVDLRDPDTQAGLKKHGYTGEEISRYISQGYTAHQVAGRMTPVLVSPNQWKALISISLQGKEAWQVRSTALHEAFEAARNFMLTDEEVKVLDARIPGRGGKAASEVQADAFANYMMRKRPALTPRTVQAVFDKIRNFFERLGNYLRGLGFESAEDIFERLGRGEIRERYEGTGREAAAEAGFRLEEAEKEDLKEVLSHPETSVPQAVNEKQHLKSLIRAEIEGEELPEGWAIRFADVGYIKSLLQQRRLPLGSSFEGRAGISATRVRKGMTPVAYGSNYKHSAAIAIPKEYIVGEGQAPHEVLINPKTPLDRLRFYIDGQDRSFAVQELREIQDFGERRIPAFKLEGDARKGVDALKSPDFPARAGQDEGFKRSVRKNRLGLVKVTDNDLKLWERALSLPFWLQEKYRELRPLVQTQMKREESRSETIHGLLKRAQDFFALKGEELFRVEKAIIQGDRESRVYEDSELKDKFKLNPEGIDGYRAVRKTLDWIHAEWKARIEENILREYKKEKWYSLFRLAHGLDLPDEELAALGKALKKTYKATEKPIEVIKEHLQKIFEEKLTQEDKRLLVKNYVEAYNKARRQLDQIKKIVRDTIGEGMSEEDLNRNTKALVLAYVHSLPAMTQLKEIRDELNRIRGYFPRSRKQGKYRVVVLDEFEDPVGNKEKVTVFYQNAANRLEATKIYDKLAAHPQYKDLDIRIEPNRQEAETTFMGASAVNMQRLVDNAIEKLKAQGSMETGTANLIRLNVLETLADDLKARGAGRFAIKRAENVIEGYQKTNLKEVLKDYIDGWSGMITKQEAALEFLLELKDIPRSRPQLMAYASKYAQDMLRNQEPMDRVSAKMRSLAFLYFLGGSLRAAAVNFTQNYVTGIPFLAREVGAKSLKAEKLYHRAMFDVAMGKNLSDVEQRMIEEMINKGIAEDQYIRQITREVKGAVGKTVGQITDILSKPFSWMEKLNRKSAALAMFREKYRSYLSNKTYTSEQAYRKAFSDSQDFVYKTHYLMTKANLPSVAAGGDIGAQFLKTAYTFRRFTHNYLLSLHYSFNGEDGKLALDVLARSLAYVVLLAGLPAIPFLDDLLDELEKFFGKPFRSEMRKTLRDAGGPVFERIGMAGIPALMGINISGSLKTGIPLVGAGTPSDTLYGVYGGLFRKGLNAMSAIEREDYLRALEFASPAFIEAVLKAYRMADQGATTPRGKMITDEQGKPIRLGAPEAAAQAMGFRPERLARISGEHWTMENVRGHFKERRDDLYARFRLAKAPEERQRVIRDMQRFNMEARKYGGVIPPITMTSLRQAVKQQPEKPFVSFGRLMEASPYS